MRTPRPGSAACALLAACLLFIVGACGPSAASSDPGPGSSTPAQVGNGGERIPRFGEKYRFDSGIVITVSEPTSFRPSQSAYPPTEKAVAFELTVRNETSHRYRISGMSVTATADQREMKRLTDPTQGYTGLVASSEGLPAEHETVLNLAFALPEAAKHLRLAFTPDRSRPAEVTYAGRMPETNTSAR